MLKNFCGKHKKGTENSGIKAKTGILLFDSILNVPEADWDTITSGNFFMTIQYLRVLESYPPSNMKFRYALIYKNKKPVAAAYFQLIALSGDNLGASGSKNDSESDCPVNVKQNLKKFLIKSADKVTFNVLICGNSFISGEHGYVYSKDIDPKEAFGRLDEIVTGITDSVKSKGKISAILVKDFYENSPAFYLEKSKYHKFSVESNMVLKFDKTWKNFDDYLNAMSSKYRKRAKSILKKHNAITTLELGVREIEKYKEDIGKLYNAVHLKAKFRMATLEPDYFIGMKNELGKKFTFSGYFLEDKLIAFRTSFILKDKLEAHFIGLDYKLNREFDLYNNILYEYIKEGFENKLNTVYFGRTASEIKSTVGAIAYDLTCYVRHRNSISNALIKPFIEYLQPPEWIPRSPFKEIITKDLEPVEKIGH